MCHIHSDRANNKHANHTESVSQQQESVLKWLVKIPLDIGIIHFSSYDLLIEYTAVDYSQRSHHYQGNQEDQSCPEMQKIIDSIHDRF